MLGCLASVTGVPERRALPSGRSEGLPRRILWGFLSAKKEDHPTVTEAVECLATTEVWKTNHFWHV